MEINYQKICKDFLKDLPERTREVISRRFGLSVIGAEKETLEQIGKSYDITRERVRQIEEDGLSILSSKTKNYGKILKYFAQEIKKRGELKREDLLLEDLGGKLFQNQAFFLLTLGNQFQRFSETKDLYPFWTTNGGVLKGAQNFIQSFINKLEEIKHPISLKEYGMANRSLVQPSLSYLEISKKIQLTEKGLYGLREWPEVNPRGVKDKAYLVFKDENKPLHFSEVANLIPGKALAQTVHNELIKDPRFVLVGRGLYALKEWGYEEGVVKDVILKALQEAKKPLTKGDILDRVLKQRMVKESTVLLNLGNKRYFQKTPDGNYTVKEA